MRIYPSYILVTLFLLYPGAGWADGVGNFDGLITWAFNVIDQLSVIAFSAALLVFFWGLAKFVLNAASSEDHKSGIALMTWGLLAFFVIVSIFGLVNFVQNSLGVEDKAMPGRPVITI